MRQFLARTMDAGRRLDVVVAELYPQLTRSSLEPLFEKGFVSVAGQPAKASHKLRQGEKIVIEETYLKRKPPKLKLPIIYEDDDVLVIDKPSGILTHSKGALNFEATVASFIKPKITDKQLSGNRAGIVHRLDRATSGVIIAAKNAESQKHLQRQFSQRKANKTYIALVEGIPEPSQAIIDAPIARNPKKPHTFTVMAGGKPAQTEYQVHSEGWFDENRVSEVVLKPLTGRTHQLRVHMSYIGHPVVGDTVYGRTAGQLMLHAAELELTLPGGDRQLFRSKLPPRFKEYKPDA